MKDFLEREIQVGDYFTQAGRRGSNLWLKVGKVIGFAASSQYSYNKEGRIIVKTVTQSWRGPHQLGKKAYIECPNRMTVIHKEDVPQKYLEILEQA